MTTPEVDFVAANVALRPPRVAMLIPDGDGWREWAMRALAIASEYWGGGGFILVPYDRVSAQPAESFRDVVRAYDPDHVVVLKVPARDFESWHPGSIRIDGVSGDAERSSIIERIPDGVDDPAAQLARSVVASWCSPLRGIRHRKERPARQRETVITLEKPNRDDRQWRGLPVAPKPEDVSFVAASATWRSNAGMFSAALVGVTYDEAQESGEPTDSVLDWLIAPSGAAPSELLRPGQDLGPLQPEPLFRVGQGLMQVSRGYTEDAGGIVIGDTAADFALAVAYDRILGRGIWLTPAQVHDDNPFKNDIRRPVARLISQMEHSARHLAVTSTSLTQRQVIDAAEWLQEPEFEFQRFSRRRDRAEEHRTVQSRSAKLDRGLVELVVDEHVGVSLVLPMAIAEGGTRESLTGLESPVPGVLLYAADLGQVPYWYVDVALARDKSPRGRDLPSSAVLAVDEGQFPEVNLRASKHGITYDPSSMGFVAGGTLLPGRIGRPRLRSLSVRDWVEGMAEAAGLGVRLSLPGRHAELVRRRLGSRDRLIDLVAGSARPMLRSFIPETAAPKRRDPDRVVLGLEPYLSFAAIDQLLPGGSDEAVQLIDELSSARLLRRGLVLGCEECGRPSFVDADKIGQQYECPQCATVNHLVSSRWRTGFEPRWFYDLHATFRELLSANGDVPLLAAAHLRATARTYADSPELEFFEIETSRSVAEVDVIASIDHEVVIVEAKSNGEFSSRTRASQTRKLTQAANAIRADRLVLATTRDKWKPSDVTHVSREFAIATPFAVDVQVITALGR